MGYFTYKSKYGVYNNCYFEVGRYENGNTAVSIWSNEEGPITKVTVNPDLVIPYDYIAIKDYSENEGMVDFLKREGLIVDEPIKRIAADYVFIPIYRLTDKGKLEFNLVI